MSSFKLKVLLTGAAAVGKTSLVHRFIKNKFKKNYQLTVGVDILAKDVEIFNVLHRMSTPYPPEVFKRIIELKF